MNTTERNNQNERFLATLAATADKKTLRLGMDYVGNVLWYGVQIGTSTYLLRTDHLAWQPNELPPGLDIGDASIQGSPISADGMRRYVHAGVANGPRLIDELTQYFARHAKFRHDAIPAVLAHWVVAGYAHMVFSNFPYLSIASAQPACGKTRVLELLAEVGFRAKPLVVNPTAAVLYRSLHDSAQVMLIDEFEDATDDSKRAMISVLNSGFLRGGTVPRCVGENHDIKHFQAYGPKAFAGLSRIPDALRTRSIPILMMPKTPFDGIRPFFPTEYERQAQKWRDDAGIWALCNARELAAAAMARDRLGIPAYLDDREVDYMTPLFATANVAGSDIEALRAFCCSLAETRQARAAQGQATRASQVLAGWFPEGQGEAKMFLSEAARMLYECEAIHDLDERQAGELLRSMGLDVRQIRIGTESRKGVTITREQANELSTRFAAPVQPESTGAPEVEMAA